MSTIKAKKATPVAFMPGFEPYEVLFTGPGALYPSRFSADWAVRKYRAELARAQAMAIHRNRRLVNPERFAKVAEDVALREFGCKPPDYSSWATDSYKRKEETDRHAHQATLASMMRSSKPTCKDDGASDV
ncbi:MAG: hypothetical protein IPI20_18710 [Rhodoferax sp.]|nr:hypothetical protein [Rhodoferax sp.]